MISDELLYLLAEEYKAYVDFFSWGINGRYTFEDYLNHYLQHLEKDKERCLHQIQERIKNQCKKF